MDIQTYMKFLLYKWPMQILQEFWPKKKDEEPLQATADKSYESSPIYFLEKIDKWWRRKVYIPVFLLSYVVTVTLLILLIVYDSQGFFFALLIVFLLFFLLTLLVGSVLARPPSLLAWRGREAFDANWDYVPTWQQENFRAMNPKQARKAVNRLRNKLNRLSKQVRAEISETFYWDECDVPDFSRPENRTMVLSYVQDKEEERRTTMLGDVRTVRMSPTEQNWMFVDTSFRNITKVWHDGCPRPGMLTDLKAFEMMDGTKQSPEQLHAHMANKANGLIPYAMSNSIIYVVMPSGPRFKTRPIFMEYGPADLLVRLLVASWNYRYSRLDENDYNELPVYVGGYVRVWTLAESMMGVIHGRISLSTMTKQRISCCVGIIEWCIAICEEQASIDLCRRGAPAFGRLMADVRAALSLRKSLFYSALEPKVTKHVESWYENFSVHYEEIKRSGPWGMILHLKIALKELLRFVALIDAADSSVPKEIVEVEFMRRMEDAPLGVEGDRFTVVGMAACLLRRGGKGLQRVSGLIRKLRTFEVDTLGEGTIALVGKAADWDAMHERISITEKIRAVDLALLDNRRCWLLDNPEYALEGWVRTSVGDSFMGNISGWRRKHGLLNTLRNNRGLINEWTESHQKPSSPNVIEISQEPWDEVVTEDFIRKKVPVDLLAARQDVLKRLDKALKSKKQRMVPLLGRYVPWFYDQVTKSAILYVAVIPEMTGILELVIPSEGTPPVLHAELENHRDLKIALESEVDRTFNMTEESMVKVKFVLQLVLQFSDNGADLIAFRNVKRRETVGRIPLPVGYLARNAKEFFVPHSDVMSASGEIMDHADDYERLVWNEKMTSSGFRREGSRLFIDPTDPLEFGLPWAKQVLERWHHPWRNNETPETIFR